MSLRDSYLARNEGSPSVAAAKLAKDLTIGDPSIHKAGYTRANAILAALDIFPEVQEDSIRSVNGWDPE